MTAIAVVAVGVTVGVAAPAFASPSPQPPAVSDRNGAAIVLLPMAKVAPALRMVAAPPGTGPVEDPAALARHQYNAGIGAAIGGGVGALVGFLVPGIGIFVMVPGAILGAGIGALIGWATP